MLGHIRSMLSRFLKPSDQEVALAPLDLSQGPIYAIGDLHGCLDAFLGICEEIRQDTLKFDQRPRIILLGDIVDRGPDTAGILDLLISPVSWADFMAIRGNHEDMMIAFLSDPHRNISWLDFGGFETLQSYGLSLDISELRQLSQRRAQQILHAHIPQEHINLLKSLPFGYQTQAVNETWVFSHAGANSKFPLTNQPINDLIWGRDFAKHRDNANFRLLFGHVIQDEVNIEQKWIGIDRGSYKSGTLTAVRLTMDGQILALSYGVEN